MSNIKLDPLCFKQWSMFRNSLGYLLPCCYCNIDESFYDSEFQKLVSVSKIDEHETIEEIVFSKEWKDFEENLRNDKGPPCCMSFCKINDDKKNEIRNMTYINVDDGTIIKELRL